MISQSDQSSAKKTCESPRNNTFPDKIPYSHQTKIILTKERHTAIMAQCSSISCELPRLTDGYTIQHLYCTALDLWENGVTTPFGCPIPLTCTRLPRQIHPKLACERVRKLISLTSVRSWGKNMSNSGEQKLPHKIATLLPFSGRTGRSASIGEVENFQ